MGLELKLILGKRRNIFTPTFVTLSCTVIAITTYTATATMTNAAIATTASGTAFDMAPLRLNHSIDNNNDDI